ncbi:hypothetical protein RJT34_15948 [Clitoria ternatea]|uniref:Uncharacterized protein n=1 Tax=Clitoria ternatea TaxID=43366 RepID=A0AAN9PD66_CLITE
MAFEGTTERKEVGIRNWHTKSELGVGMLLVSVGMLSLYLNQCLRRFPAWLTPTQRWHAPCRHSTSCPLTALSIGTQAVSVARLVANPLLGS